MSSPSFSSYHPDFPLFNICFTFTLCHLLIIFKLSYFLITCISSKLPSSPDFNQSLTYFLPFQLRPFSQIQLTMKSIIFINFLLASLVPTVSSVYLGKVNVAIEISYDPPRYQFILVPYGVLTQVDNCKTFLYNAFSNF